MPNWEYDTTLYPIEGSKEHVAFFLNCDNFQSSVWNLQDSTFSSFDAHLITSVKFNSEAKVAPHDFIEKIKVGTS